MRTIENWKENYELGFIESTFPPRIARDLLTLNLKELPDKEIESMFIYGKIKTGKTIRAAQMLVHEKMNIYINNLPDTTLFVSFTELFAEIRNTYSKSESNEQQVIDKYLNTDILVIDDFLTSRPTDWVIEILYRLINYRYEHLKKTIITSNLSLEEIENVLQDQRITSRIDRMCVIEEKQSYKTT